MSGRLRPRTRTLFSLIGCALLTACGSGDIGNTSLNVIVPDGGADEAGIDVQSVAYTIQCDGNDETYLEGNDSFDDSIRVDGALDVVDGRLSGGQPSEVWQAFMNLPAGPCVVQLRAFDNSGERICVADSSFTVAAGSATKVNMVLVCTISFRAPTGSADIDATFSFVVGNFCPDLIVLNYIDTDPATGDVEVQVRGYDPDSQCGQNCDPQTCDNTVVPPVCSPGPDPGVSITVSADIGTLDCDQDATPDGSSCTFVGDQYDDADMDYACDATMPGATATITALITDGDVDCDETKEIQVTCP